jgi:fumarylacetoacetate (FAA) hydrolase family protein
MIELSASGVYLGRIWRAGIGPCVATLRRGRLVDITSPTAPTMRDVLEQEDIAGFVNGIAGTPLEPLSEIAVASRGAGPDVTRLLAPCDLQAIKACGVTFARSLVERVIEEAARGDPARADEIRARVADLIGDQLRSLVPGSDAAAEVKAVLQRDGLWSQYLEVGIGPDAEVFTKGQPMSAVGWGAEVGLHPISHWNNPEPEVVLAVDSRGRIVGATLGNDVNLRDVEGRSALLLGKAKDNNAAAAIGPFIRIFDDSFTLDDVRAMEVQLKVEGEDGFVLDGTSSMSEISRDPADLVAQARGRHHQYPDGFMLYLGTMFAPVQDRDTPGEGFTHKRGDLVTIRAKALGALVNRVNHCDRIAPWSFGSTALMLNLAQRGLL